MTPTQPSHEGAPATVEACIIPSPTARTTPLIVVFGSERRVEGGLSLMPEVYRASGGSGNARGVDLALPTRLRPAAGAGDIEDDRVVDWRDHLFLPFPPQTSHKVTR